MKNGAMPLIEARLIAAPYLRPVILFAAAYLIIGIIHESAHALAAYVFDVPFTLFHFGVDVTRDRGTLVQHAIIGVMGPLCALIAGLTCWLVFRWINGSRSELMFLYLAVFGVGTFFGNLMSASFVGDFSRAALALQLPMAARYGATIVGLLLLFGLHFLAGWELRRLSPPGSSKFNSMVVMVVIPVLAAIIIVAQSFWSIPSTLISGRVGEASFWVFTAAGALMSRKIPSGSVRTLRLAWADIALLLAAIIVVRVMAGGIAFRPDLHSTAGAVHATLGKLSL
jgi:hypothetical protein